MRLRRILVGLVAVLVGGGIGACLGLRTLDLDQYKGVIAAEVKDITGRDLAIDGHITFTLSLRPTVTLRDLALANASWAGQDPMLEVDRVVVTFDLIRLIFGTFDTTELLFSGGRLRLSRSADGAGNWDMGIDEEGVERTEDYLKGPFPYVHAIELRDFDYDYETGDDGLGLKGHLDHFTALYDPRVHDLQVGLDGKIKEQTISAKGTASKITTLYAGGASEVDFAIALAQTKLSLSGIADSTGKGPAFQGDYTASGPGLLDLAQLAAVTLPDLGALVASGKLTVSDTAIALTDLKARLGLSDLAGKLSIGLGPAQPIAADLTSTRLDLTPWLGDVEAALPASDDSGTDAVFSDAPLGLADLPPLDLEVKLQTDSFTAGSLTLKSLLLQLQQKGTELHIAPFSVDYKGATFSGNIGLKAAETPELTLKILTQNFDLGSFLKESDVTDLVSGEIDVGVDVEGKGDSVHDLVAGLDGKAGFVMSKGQIASRYVDLIAVDLLQQMMPWKKSIEEAKVKCALGQFVITDGKAKIQTLLFDTKNMTMNGAGHIDLAKEKVNLRLYPRPKDPSLFSLATGLRVTGSFSETHVSVDPWSLIKDAAEAAIGVALAGPAGLLVPFASLGAGHNHPCVNDLQKVFGVKAAEDMKAGKGEAALDAAEDTAPTASSPTTPLPTEVLISLRSSQITESVMKEHLQDLGFTDINSVRKNGTVFYADAAWQGAPVKLRIDSRLGSITQVTP